MSSTNATPQQIGKAFVVQYYRLFHKHPKSLHRFYSSSSTLVQPVTSVVEQTSNQNHTQMQLEKKKKTVATASTDNQPATTTKTKPNKSNKQQKSNTNNYYDNSWYYGNGEEGYLESDRTWITEPESQSFGFFLANILVLIYILLFVVTWPYTFIYLIAHPIAFLVINKRLTADRLYIPKKNLINQTVIVYRCSWKHRKITAFELVKPQARVIVGIRGQERAQRVAQELSNKPPVNVISYHLDLSDLANVKAFTAKIDKVDILFNNAGAVKQRELTKDGPESTFG